MKEKEKRLLTKAGWLLFYLYIIILSYFLFFSERYGRDCITSGYRYNLELFREIRRFIEYRQLVGAESFVVNILGNVLAFSPFGFLLALLDKKYCKLLAITILSFAFSLVAESVQLILKVGIFDVDDIFLNTVGGILGYLIYRFIAAIFHKYQRKNDKRRS